MRLEAALHITQKYFFSYFPSLFLFYFIIFCLCFLRTTKEMCGSAMCTQ